MGHKYNLSLQNTKFKNGLHTLGLLDEAGQLLLPTNNLKDISSEVIFHLEKAKLFNADYVFFKKEIGGIKPQAYIYDCTSLDYSEDDLAHFQKKIWSNGAVPLACFFYNTEIKIIDCSTHTKNDKPIYLLENLTILSNAHEIFNNEFALKIKSGEFWNFKKNSKRFKFKSSSYDILIQWIKAVYKEISDKLSVDESIVYKIIVQSILIKYLEERKDSKGRKLFHEKYFEERANTVDFADTLRKKGQFAILLDNLQEDFNGNIFSWTESEKEIISNIDLSIVADALEGYESTNNLTSQQKSLRLIRYYEFSYVPVELISRIYEEFLAGKETSEDQSNTKRKNGVFYTPSHLAKLLVDESMPIKNYDNLDIFNYKVLDPSCGSGIFLVLAFKRLVQWWRLQNDLERPTPEILKLILNNVYGVDKEYQAIKLTSFSLCLALCDELDPMQIISDLTFEDLNDNHLIDSDFFLDEIHSQKTIFESNEHKKLRFKNFNSLKNVGFSLIIGNPPFSRSGNKYSKTLRSFWKVKFGKREVDIPSKQIALKFLYNSLRLLKPGGLQCLILKSSGFLYNPTARDFRFEFFKNFHVSQIFDFTSLSRNKTLWDSGADVDTIALFTKNEEPDSKLNILHATFRRTRYIKDRLGFELDEQDLHFVNRTEAKNSEYIWKINLMGGGRLHKIIEKLTEIQPLSQFLDENKVIAIEGESGGRSLHNNAFKKTFIDTSIIDNDYYTSFKTDNIKFEPPNFLIKENISFPFALNKIKIPYSNEVVGFRSEDNWLDPLKELKDYFNSEMNIIKMFTFCTSSKALVYKNTSILKADILRLPFEKDLKKYFDNYERILIQEILSYQQDFLRHGENSKSVSKINIKDILRLLKRYSNTYLSVLNPLFENQSKKFRLTDVISLFDNTFIGVIFKYTKVSREVDFNVYDSVNTPSILKEFSISDHLTSKRTIRYYGIDDTIIIIKPSENRFWLSSSAYKDADKTFSDLTQLEFNAG